MQRQTNMLNLFVEFKFQLLNMTALFHFKLRISADGKIENLKTRNIALNPTIFRSTEMFKNVAILSRKRCSLTRVLKCLLVSPIQRAPQLTHEN